MSSLLNNPHNMPSTDCQPGDLVEVVLYRGLFPRVSVVTGEVMTIKSNGMEVCEFVGESFYQSSVHFGLIVKKPPLDYLNRQPYHILLGDKVFYFKFEKDDDQGVRKYTILSD